MTSVPADYLERVYAGVLGKLIGVYLGRPFEGWTYQRIMKELGPIEYYVHDRLGAPLVVTDDDVSGTFTFVRALAEHGVKADLTAEEIGKTWLNSIIEQRSILWWGGNGNSTEHTAWLNLKRGLPAPHSGSIATNGQAVAEQIGAQIFIDGWALVAPGQPKLAAKLAEAAGSVSHDGESVHAAKLLAAMEAEAFLTSDIDHLIDVGLSVIPANSLIASLARDVRAWSAELTDWREARQRIEDHYGYDKYPGNCHVVPNHALILLALIYSRGDFHQAMTIVNTAGWDTDCNSGNVGCLIGIMHGLKGLEGGPDWRGPLADRALISASDGGYAVNDAVRIACDIASLGLELAGLAPLTPPKDGAQFHFALPGSVQGFMAERDAIQSDLIAVEHGEVDQRPALALRFKGLAKGRTGAALTPVFSPPDVVDMRTYDMQASPRVYPGQTVTARLIADRANTSTVQAALRIKVYGLNDRLFDFDGPSLALAPGDDEILTWTLPDLDGQPIQKIGVALTSGERRADGTVFLDYSSLGRRAARDAAATQGPERVLAESLGQQRQLLQQELPLRFSHLAGSRQRHHRLRRPRLDGLSRVQRRGGASGIERRPRRARPGSASLLRPATGGGEQGVPGQSARRRPHHFGRGAVPLEPRGTDHARARGSRRGHHRLRRRGDLARDR